MADGLVSNRWVKIAARIGALLTLAAVLAVIVYGIAFLAMPRSDSAFLLLTVVQEVGLLLAALAAGAWAVAAMGVVDILVAGRQDTDNLSGRIERVEAVLESQAESLTRLIDLATLSDRAKSLIYRERELEAFLETIHAALMRQDYDSAESLIRMVEQNGYAAEAERLRQEVAASHRTTNDDKVEGYIERINEILARFDWERAKREAARLLQVFPESQRVQDLPKVIEQARTRRKRDLLQRYGEAVRKNDIEAGIELLKQLDRYLTPREAAALRDSARGVFRAKLHNLGVQFAIHVADQRWAQAVDCGEQIMRDFPNSRMAHEVREKIEILRSRAAGNAPVEK